MVLSIKGNEVYMCGGLEREMENGRSCGVVVYEEEQDRVFSRDPIGSLTRELPHLAWTRFAPERVAQ